MTHRQFQVWLEFLKDDWNNPSRSDYYQMQTTLEVIRSRGKVARKAKLNDLKIPFEDKTMKKAPLSGPRVVTKEDILRVQKLSALKRVSPPKPRRPVPQIPPRKE